MVQMSSDTAQRVAVVAEQNKSGTWSVAAYLTTADGQRYRRALATCQSYEEATTTLRGLWQEMGPAKAA